MLRAMRRELETEPRPLIHGHAGGNPGYSQGATYGLPRQFPTLPGHNVTVFVRSPQKLGSLRQRVVVREGDPRRVADLRDILPGHDAVISTLGPAGVGPTTILRAA